MAAASSCWSAGASRQSRSGGAGFAACHPDSAAAGSRASRSRPARESGTALAAAGHGRTSPRVACRPVSRRRSPACGWVSPSASHAASSSAVSRPGRTTRPFGRLATARSRRATAGMPPVVPATHTGVSGGASAQACAWASSRATCRAAGFIRPCSASQSGHIAVTIRRKASVLPQCSAWAASAASGRACARSISARSASSIKAASSLASRHAPSALRGAPLAPCSARIIRLSAARRGIGSTAGGTSSAPASVSGTSSSAPNAVMRGSSSGAPSVARRNASASARAARRVGSMMSPRDASSRSPPRASQAAASASRNGACAGMVNRFTAYRRWRACAGRFRRPPGRPVWTGGTTTRHAPPRAAARRPAPGPRPG